MLAHQEYDRKRRTAAIADGLVADLQPLRIERRDGFTYPGLFGRPVVTDLLIIRDGPLPVVIATERGDNPGASITNTIESLAKELMTETGWLIGDFILIEHYPDHRYGENLGRSLSQVSFERMWSGPTWKYIDTAGLKALIRPQPAGVCG